METFNKNWLAILLIAVVFGTLGFLLGRTTGHHAPAMMMMEKNLTSPQMAGDSLEVKVEVSDDANVETTVTTDTLMKDGKKIIVKEVRKIRK